MLGALGSLLVIGQLSVGRHSTIIRVSADQPEKSTNYARRSFRVVLALLPLALLFASIIVGASRPQQSHFAAVGTMIAAAVVASINFYLSVIRPRLFLLRRGSMDGYRFVSGIPIIGTLLLSIGALSGFGAIGSALIGMGAFALDTGGSFWFVIATRHDRSFWDT